MSGGELVEFLWTEGDMPQKLPAAEYIGVAMEFVKKKLEEMPVDVTNDDENADGIVILFPQLHRRLIQPQLRPCFLN